MGDFAGGGADNLDYSSHTYARLRSAVYALTTDGPVVAQNEWADLKRRLNERIGTLHVAIAKLTPAWISAGGHQAIVALTAHRDWLTEFARVAAWNEERVADVEQARRNATLAMKALDAEPGGPQRPDSGSSTPRPTPGPDPDPAADPASQDWRQPYAAKIANYVFGQMAVAAASLAKAPVEWKPVETGSRPDNGGIPGDGPVLPSGSSAGPTRPRSGPNAPTSPHPSRGGGSGPGNVIGPPRAPSRPLPTPGTPLPPAGTSPPGGAIGQARDRRSASPLPRRPAETGATSGAAGAHPGSRQSAAPGHGTSRESVPPPPHQRATGRVIGGGLRPIGGSTPTGGEPSQRIPSQLQTHGQPDKDPPRRRKKPGYERGEPETFIDGRPRNPRGGIIRPATAAPAPVVVDPGRGIIGASKRRDNVEQNEPWSVPEPVMPPTSAPDTGQETKRNEEYRHEVRGSRSGPAATN